MPLYYLADSATGANRGQYIGPAVKAGTVDTGEAPADPRMIWSGSAWELPVATGWLDIRSKQSAMIEEVRWIVERTLTQKELGLAEGARDIDDTKYAEYLQYMQDIREQDEGTHATPELADAALDALTKPTH